MSTFEEVKKEISEKYCRSLVVIDDEIFDEIGGFTDRFNLLREQFEKSGILTHFFNYKDKQVDSDDLRERAVKLSEKSDIIILDWQLDTGDTPEEAIKIIKHLIDDQKIRFIIINTQKTLDTVHKTLGNVLKKEKGFDKTNDNSYEINNRTFITIRKKDDTKNDAKNLLDHIYSLLDNSFPDYLHWAALALAVESRELFPKIMAKLPQGTNGALIFQMLYQKDNEVAHQVAEVLLDELRVRVTDNPLASVQDNLLFDELQKATNTKTKELKSDELVQKLAPDIIKSINDENKRKKGLKNVVKKIENESLKNDIIEIIDRDNQNKGLEEEKVIINRHINNFHQKWQANDLDLNLIREQLSSNNPKESEYFIITNQPHKPITKHIEFVCTDKPEHNKWANLRESVLLESENSNKLQVGSVWTKKNDSNKYYLCVTPSCDCYHPKEGFLFIIGQEADIKASKKYETQYFINKTHIKFDATRFHFENYTNQLDNPLPTDYDFIGILRAEFVNRIIQRVWSYQSRVGVDTSEYIRKLRNE